MKRIWRVSHRDYVDSAFSGIGAMNDGGRWNNPGTPMVYASDNLSLAVLEIFIHLKFAQALLQYVAIPVDVDKKLIDVYSVDLLPEGWNLDPVPFALRNIGDQWCRSETSPVLAIPSAVVPLEKNYLINPSHPDFGKIQIGDPIPIPIDSRLLNWGKD